MKIILKTGLLIFSGILIILSSCRKFEEYPIIPHIEFVSFAKIYNDLKQSDTIPPYDYNFYISYFEKQNGEFVELILDPPLNARIPMLTPSGINKSIKGEIEDEIFLNYTSQYDTIRLEVYILDRALHKSNVIQTPEIYIK
jgi:hypothetical protein